MYFFVLRILIELKFLRSMIFILINDDGVNVLGIRVFWEVMNNVDLFLLFFNESIIVVF